MKSVLAWNLLIIFGCMNQSLGQSEILSDSIERYARELIRNQDLNVRERAFEYLNSNLGEYLTGFANFKDTLPRMEGLAIQEDEELRLRIVTYQLYRDTSHYDYGGWVQSDLLKEPVFLSDASSEWESDEDIDYATLDPGGWYGVLYYQILPFKISDDEISIIVLGLDNFHFFTKRKILDVLVIREGELYFGEPIIEMEKGLPEEFRKKRFILDYSVQAPATFRYDSERSKIIFDHLVFMPSDIREQRIMRVPDGTYSGFEVDKNAGKLVFIEKVFDQVMEEAPGGRNESRTKRDLFGNPE